LLVWAISVMFARIANTRYGFVMLHSATSS